MLRGGFKSGYIYEIVGNEATGKTHLCHHLCIEVASSGHKSLYIDSKACFSAEKLVMEIKGRKDANFKATLNNIFLQRPTDVYELCDILQSIMEDEEYKNIELLVIDALDALVEPHYIRLQYEDWVGDQEIENPEEYQSSRVKEQQFQFSRDLTTMLKQLMLLNERLCIVVVNSPGRRIGPTWKQTDKIVLTFRKLPSEQVLEVELTKCINSKALNKCNVEVCLLGFRDHPAIEQ